MIDLLFIPLFAAHLLLVNVAAAGPLVCVWLEWRATRRGDTLAGEVARKLARDSAWGLALAMLLGGVLLAVLWQRGDSAYFDAVQSLPIARLWFALAELVFSLACLLAYSLLWNRLGHHRVWHRVLAILAGTNLMYHFPPLFSLISVLADRPERWGQTLSRTEIHALLLDPQVVSRVVHIWLASIAVVGTLLVFYALKLRRTSFGTEYARVAVWGAWIALVPSILQLFVGIWLLLQMSDSQRNLLLGDNLLATGLFAAGVLSALRMLHQLATMAFGEHSPRQCVGVVATMIATVVLMTATLHLAARRIPPSTGADIGLWQTSERTFPS